MARRLDGKRALITGAGQGIGRAIALAYAAEGATVIATSRTLEKMRDLEPHGIAIRQLDVGDADAVAREIAAALPLHILCNCAGWVHHGTILDCSDADWEKSLHHNVTACFWTMRAVLPGMLERGSGSIVNVASVASSITGVANRAAYGTSKAALIGLTKATARDVIKSGVRVNALCPGTTLSPSLEDRINAADDPEQSRRDFVARQPMGRLGTVEEIAAAAVYLAADESAFMTGQTLVVDGGLSL